MAATEEARKTDLVDRLAHQAKTRVAPESSGEAAKFVEEYFEFVAPDDILYTVPETLLGGALSLWDLGAERPHGASKVRVFNPTGQQNNWSSEHTVLEIVNDDMPFLVDSVTAELKRHERNIHLVIHPVMGVRRDLEGRRLGPGETNGGDELLLTESYMHIEFDQQTEPAELQKIRASIDEVLHQVRVAVTDWHPMKRKLEDSIIRLDRGSSSVPRELVDESLDFLRWLADDHFLFLGYRRYEFRTDDRGRDFLDLDGKSGLGILRNVRPESLERTRTAFSREFSEYARRPEPIIITKANSRSRVHKPAPMDRISVKEFDAQGRFVAEDRFLGLFTSVAYNTSVREIPVLRSRFARIMERSGLAAASHDGKALIEILETLPRDEMFQSTEDDLFEIAMGVLQLQDRQRVGFFYRKDVFERFVSGLVYVPRDRFDAEFRDKARAILEEAFNGTVIETHAHVTDAPLARGLFIIRTTPGSIPPVDAKKIEVSMIEASRTWGDRLLSELDAALQEETAIDQHRRFRRAFPLAYTERFDPATAVRDIALIDRVLQTGEIAVDLYRREGRPPNRVRAKVFHTGTIALSELMPRLENMGMKVRSEIPFDVTPLGAGQSVRIRDFSLLAPVESLEIPAIKGNFEETLGRVWRGETEDDGFNRLVINPGLRVEQVLILRAYCKYLRQTGIALSEASMQQTMANNPAIARMLIELFETTFNPVANDPKRASQIGTQVEQALEAVSNPDEDRILRRYLNLIETTLRTNYYQKDADGNRKPYLSFKFDSRKVEGLPLPRPMVEIFLYSPRVEGVHLRGGKVARGGLRWSDRREDFRTEILGLMKAQNVKNTVIVPVGSKGGFVVKAPQGGTREEVMSEGIACYKTFIRGLLDLTDNYHGDAVIPPKDVVRRDGDDPYLVVAADKGTATFSDIANSISLEYGHWLGDAFASGGSAGYDHKKMGITAKGGWEAIKLHFRELGIDCQTTDFTCVGIGDMSGDVFGNAMLLSAHTKLIGAFNHLHIFVDPDPDPARSLVERKRLFSLPRSSWSDYDPKVMSKGGAVFERRAKTVTVSDQVRERFDLKQNTVTPIDLMQAILRARADLMWLGGIGTYVKASYETHADARDRANDPVRINGNELRVRVLGEGANLGLTQQGRIEYALATGGRLNTDAIDNSAGVDCSDHEVNIKILVDEAITRGEIKPEERLPLLAEMTGEVERLVLRDNYQQTQVISAAFAQGPAVIDQQLRFMRFLERQGKLDRSIEGLPDDETIAERQAAHLGLTRPELAVVLAYSKIWLYDELLDSQLPDDPQMLEDLILYFPKQLRAKYRAAIERHRLRREIIAAFVTNHMINRTRPTFVSRMIEETGRKPDDVARAYAIVRDSFDLRTSWKAIEKLDNQVPAALQTQMFIEIAGFLERTTLWLLRNYDKLDMTRCTEDFRPRINTLAEKLHEVLPPTALAAIEQEESANLQLGLPPALARRRAISDVLSSGLDVVRQAIERNEPVERVAKTYFHLGARFDLDRLRDAAANIAAETPWQRQAIAMAVDDLYALQGTLAARVMTEEGSLDAWLGKRQALVTRVDQILTEIRGAPTLDLAMLAVANRQMRTVVES
jgi:glutamate dehydrogenase